MKKSRIGAWILIVALLMQNIPLSVWASEERTDLEEQTIASQNETVQQTETSEETEETLKEKSDVAENVSSTDETAIANHVAENEINLPEDTLELKGKVFFDENKDGEYSEDEAGVAGIGIKVYSAQSLLTCDKEVIEV